MKNIKEQMAEMLKELFPQGQAPGAEQFFILIGLFMVLFDKIGTAVIITIDTKGISLDIDGEKKSMETWKEMESPYRAMVNVLTVISKLDVKEKSNDTDNYHP